MSDSGRFCVQFSGTALQSSTKTRILYKDSKPSDFREIWKAVCNSNPPDDIQLIIANHTTYNLSDEGDFNVVMAIAEDQYRANPSNPLHITFAHPPEYKLNTPPSSNPSPEQPTTSADSSKDNHEDPKSPSSENELQIVSSPPGDVDMEETAHAIDADIKTDENPVAQDLSIKKKVTANQPEFQTLVQTIFNRNMENPGFSGRKNIFHKFSDEQLNHNVKPAYFQFPDNRPFQPRCFNYRNDSAEVDQSGTGALPPCPVSAPNVLSSGLQPHLLHNSANASLILQTIFKNKCDQRKAAMNWFQQYAQQNINNSNGFIDKRIDYKYFGERENFAANAVPGLGMQRNKKRPKIVEMDGKAQRVSRRMRSSSSLSNVEFHCEQAKQYMSLPLALQKEHNSAHRSHWKHLSHVMKIWPEFVVIYKHKKYDEWSSEARDIFAITLPDEYKWSFLTLSKKGEQLCERMKKRIEDLMSRPPEERPEWCPSEETMQRAWLKADERYQQLIRIQDARVTTGLSPSTSKQRRGSPTEHFPISSQPPLPLNNPVSSFRPDMLRDCGFNFFEQQKNFNGRLKPMAPNQSFMSPVRPIIHSDTSLAQNQGMNLGSPEDVGFGLSQKDRNTVFINRMRELAINAQQGLPSSSFDIETSNLSLPKPQPIPPQPNSPPVSPRSPKPIG